MKPENQFLNNNWLEQIQTAIIQHDYDEILALLDIGTSEPVMDPLCGWEYLWSLQLPGDEPEEDSIRLRIAKRLLQNGASPLLKVEDEILLDSVCYALFNDSLNELDFQYRSKFLIMLIAYGGKTNYCNVQMVKPLDIERIDDYWLQLCLEPDGYHLSGRIMDKGNNVVAHI